MSLLQRVERAQQPISPDSVPVEPPKPPPPPTPARIAARDELLRQIRLSLQQEVTAAFSTLLDVTDPAQLRTRVEGIDLRGKHPAVTCRL